MISDGPVRRLLFVHEDAEYAELVRGQLAMPRGGAFRVAHYAHLKDALNHLEVSPVDLVLVGTQPADSDAMAAVRHLSAAVPEVPLVALVRGRAHGPRLEARKAGASECLDADEVNAELWSRTFAYCCREQAADQEIARVTARLDWLTHMDSLTDMLNRKGLERAMMSELELCRAAGRDLIVVLADLDEFSRVNVTLGHGVGDLVLVGAARRIADCLGENDKVGRCGTDRFVVMLPDSDLAQGRDMAENIRLAISRDVIRAGAHDLKTTASLGVTAIGPDAHSFDEVLAQAHFVLQRGRTEGGNRVARAAGSDSVARLEPVEAAPDVMRALLTGEALRVASQPIVNLADGRIVSREMLVRGPTGPLESPDNLFRFCQEKDILTAVDLRCLTKCSEVAHRGRDHRFHVNIMPATLLQTPTAELLRVLRVRPEYGHCCLEISEQQLLGDPSVLAPRVRELQDAGIRIAIDDVGFGNSCLEGLVMLQPQVMKIDKRMVRGLADDSDLRRSLNRILMIAEVLGAEVVAEGVETTEDYGVLLELGVRFGQGYLFGRPQLVPPEATQPAARLDESDGTGAAANA